jgi:hypothetical protein
VKVWLGVRTIAFVPSFARRTSLATGCVPQVVIVEEATQVALGEQVPVDVADHRRGGAHDLGEVEERDATGDRPGRPSSSAKLIPGSISGTGSRVIQIRTTRHLQPIVTATHRGQSNFIVHLIGFGDTSGEPFVFNEIGNYRGQTLIDDLPKGHYLLYVQADGGTWSLRFTR